MRKRKERRAVRIRALVFALALTSLAHAQDASRAYFEGERRSGFAWGGFGLVSLGTGIGFAASGRDVLMGMAGPMIGIGAIQATLGAILLARTPSRIAALDLAWKNDPHTRDNELSRIRGVNKSFLALGVIESVLIVSGAILLGAGVSRDNDVVRGAGIGTAIEMTTMLFLDSLAHHRSETYERSLE